MIKMFAWLVVLLVGLTGACYAAPLFETEGVCPDAYQMDKLVSELKSRAQSAATKDGLCIEWMISHCRCRKDKQVRYIAVYYPCDGTRLDEAGQKKRDQVMDKPNQIQEHAEGSQCGGCMGSVTTKKDKVFPAR
jgi:hypothetical protein